MRWLAVFALIFATQSAWAQPKAVLWDRWQAHDATSTQTVDHRAWQTFLQTYISHSTDGVNRVAYARVSVDDRQKLAAYLRTLQAVPVSRLNRDEQLAYWVNLYNALTVNVILEHYPVRSIRDIDISPGLFSDGPWGAKLLQVEGEKVSLDDIEHRILRPIWRDARIHYVVNCASIGCPNLLTDAFTAVNVERLLNQAANDYVNHPRGAHQSESGLVVSSIYVWFKEDFGDSDQGVIEHLRLYARPPLRATLENTRRIDDHRYDWSLNDTANPVLN